jgi:hypothetical protein
MPKLERETGVEPATSTLARSRSTTELLPLVGPFYSIAHSLPIRSLAAPQIQIPFNDFFPCRTNIVKRREAELTPFHLLFSNNANPV